MYRRNPPSFDPTLASTSFKSWFKDACADVRNADGSPKIFYRGQRSAIATLQARLVLDSYTESPEVASMYSHGKGVVFPVYISIEQPLKIDEYIVTFYDALWYLGYWDGSMSFDETVKILNYLINRSRWAGGYVVPANRRRFARMPTFKASLQWDTDLETLEALSRFKEAWEDLEDEPEEASEISSDLAIDTFAVVETPAFLRTAESLGYDGVIHADPVSRNALEKSSGKSIDDIENIYTPYSDPDWKSLHADYAHSTVRPFSRNQVWPALLYSADERQ